MIITTIITDARAALVGNAELQAWSQTNFSKSLRVDIGMDRRKMPMPTAYPLVVIADRRQILGTGRGETSVEIDLVCWVRNEEIVEDGDGQIFTGWIQASELRELCVKALVKSMRAKVTIPDQQSELSTENFIFAEVFTVAIDRLVHPITWEVR